MIDFGVTSQLNVITNDTMPKSLHFWEGLGSSSVKQDHPNTTIQPLTVQSVQFSSFWFDNPGTLHLQYIGGFHAGPSPIIVGDGDDIITELAWVTVNGIAQTCSSGRAKDKFLFLKVHHPSTENQRL